MSKPSIPEGTRDFGPEKVVKRNYIFDTIKKVFIKYGFSTVGNTCDGKTLYAY